MLVSFERDVSDRFVKIEGAVEFDFVVPAGVNFLNGDGGDRSPLGNGCTGSGGGGGGVGSSLCFERIDGRFENDV